MGPLQSILAMVLQTCTDPEHLPPRSIWESIYHRFGGTPYPILFFGSLESRFGLRVAVAAISVTILAFPRNSQHFRIKQRLTSGSIMIAIGMMLTAGSAMHGQFSLDEKI
jgi:hypothetical protein